MRTIILVAEPNCRKRSLKIGLFFKAAMATPQATSNPAIPRFPRLIWKLCGSGFRSSRVRVSTYFMLHVGLMYLPSPNHADISFAGWKYAFHP
jgi:hypothetical protein